MEDDITLDPDFSAKVKEYEKDAPADADIIFLGYHKNTFQKKFKKVNDTFGVPSKIYGLFGYVITPSGANKLLNIFPITKQIDTEISNNFKNLNVYAVYPDKKIIHSDLSQSADEFGSDIQHNIFTPRRVIVTIGIVVGLALLLYFFRNFYKK